VYHEQVSCELYFTNNLKAIFFGLKMKPLDLQQLLSELVYHCRFSFDRCGFGFVHEVIRWLPFLMPTIHFGFTLFYALQYRVSALYLNRLMDTLDK
jgi:hypothetical protein